MNRSKIPICFVLATVLAASAAPRAVDSNESLLALVTADEPGTKLVVTGSVVDSKSQPISGASLHVYQTDASGRYTPERPMDEPNARLSGWLRTDSQGRFELHTVRPGGYPKALRLGDRERKIPAHIHIDVTAPGRTPRKLQAVFADDPLLKDPYWADWVHRLQQPVLALRAEGSTSTATLQISIEP